MNEFKDSKGIIWVWDNTQSRYVKSHRQESQGQEDK